ncbi:MAG: AraC family transcriptional regulator [Flavobacterium sp.]|nr:MAG: AraC family transcriptional regulator [Flavobacterium sp.]
MISSNEVISFNDISLQLNISYKTIYRLFSKHLGSSPAQFRRILKFRTALIKGIDPAYKSKISTVALESGYFDQAHYTNEFKKIAQLTPRNFISSNWVDVSDKVVWKLD